MYKVSTVSTEVTPGEMLYGTIMFMSTKLLEAYAELGYIRHMEESSTLIFVSMQKECSCMGDALERFREELGQVTKNKKKVDHCGRVTKHLKEKNPNLNK